MVSDHGMAPFHTAVVLREVLKAGGMTDAELANLRFYTSGPAVNLYVNLSGREQGGTVNVAGLPGAARQGCRYPGSGGRPERVLQPARTRLFSDVFKRSSGCASIGFCTDPSSDRTSVTCSR